MESTKPVMNSIDSMTIVIVSESSVEVSGTIRKGEKFSGKMLSVRGVIKEMKELLHSMVTLRVSPESEFVNPLSKETLETIGSTNKGVMKKFPLLVIGFLANLETGFGFRLKVGQLLLKWLFSSHTVYK
jgi:hypothetical protein